MSLAKDSAGPALAADAPMNGLTVQGADLAQAAQQIGDMRAEPAAVHFTT